MIQICLFLICAQTIIHFRPKAIYEKYIRWVLGLMLLVLVFARLGAVFRLDAGERLEGLIVEAGRDMEQNLTVMTEEWNAPEKKRSQAEIEKVEIDPIYVEVE